MVKMMLVDFSVDSQLDRKTFVSSVVWDICLYSKSRRRKGASLLGWHCDSNVTEGMLVLLHLSAYDTCSMLPNHPLTHRESLEIV